MGYRRCATHIPMQRRICSLCCWECCQQTALSSQAFLSLPQLQGDAMPKSTPFPGWAMSSDDQGRDIKAILACNDSDINYLELGKASQVKGTISHRMLSLQTQTTNCRSPCYQTELGPTHPTHSKVNLLTPGCGEGKHSIYCRCQARRTGSTYSKDPNSLMAFR